MAKENYTLGAAKASKRDEFYTQLTDIEKELVHYREHFRDKVVLCNCDDPYESNFFKYFALNFNALGLKKLIATCYDGSPFAQQELQLFPIDESEPKRTAYKVEISEVPDMDGSGSTDLTDVQLLLKSSDHNVKSELKQNGSFDSPECIELLKQADIVVTNPPFSLFREFLALLDRYDKKFIIIGNTNAITYKESFKMFQEDKIHTGYTNFNVGMFFYVPDSYEKYHHMEGNKKVARVSSSCWYTNFPVRKHQEELILCSNYDMVENPPYINHEGINVQTYTDIPCDYNGIMGVPITFVDKINPEQFEILDCCEPAIEVETYKKCSYFHEYPSRQIICKGVLCQKTYHRLFIRNKKPQIS